MKSYLIVNPLMWLAIFCIFSLDLVNSLYSFPLTDGWWETYGWMVNNGLRPYLDFHLKFTPLFIEINSYLLSIFNANFFTFRLLGCFVHLMEFLLLVYYLARIGINHLGAIAGAFYAVLLVACNPVFIAKDYHTYEQIFLMFFLISLVSIERNRAISLIAASLSLFLIIFIKQNVGLLCVFSVVSIYVFELVRNKRNDLSLILILIMTALFLYLVTLAIGNGWLQAFIGNDAKGSLFTVMFRFLLDKKLLIVEFLALVLLGCYSVFGSRLNKFMNDKKYSAVLTFMGIFLLSSVFVTSSVVIIFSLATVLVLLKDERIRIGVPLILLAYAGTTTAGYNYVSMEIPIAIFSGVAISKLEGNFRLNYMHKAIIFIVVALSLGCNKFIGESYNWWGYKIGPILSNRYDLSFVQLKGIKSDRETADIMRYLSELNLKIDSSDEVFSYPNIPVLYFLLNKIPPTDPVLWFDVSSANDAKRIINQLEAKKPKYVFWLKPPRSVYEGHFNLIKKDPLIYFVDQYLINKTLNQEYKVVKIFPMYSKGGVAYTTNEDSQSAKFRFVVDKLQNKNPNVYFDNVKQMNDFVANQLRLVESPSYFFYVLEKVN